MNFDPKQTSLVTMQMGPNYRSVTRSLGHGSMLVRNAGKVPNDVTSRRPISMQTLEHAVGAIVNTHMSGNQFHWHANSVQRWASQSSTAVNLFWKRPWDICLLSVWILAVTDTSFSSKFFSISISIWALTKEWKEKGIQWRGGGENMMSRENRSATVIRENNAFPATTAWPFIYMPTSFFRSFFWSDDIRVERRIGSISVWGRQSILVVWIVAELHQRVAVNCNSRDDQMQSWKTVTLEAPRGGQSKTNRLCQPLALEKSRSAFEEYKKNQSNDIKNWSTLILV